MDTTNVTVRMDKKLKEEADALFSELGLTTNAAINALVRQAVRDGSVTFKIKKTPDHLASLIEEGYEDFLKRKGRPAKEFFAEMQEKYGE